MKVVIFGASGKTGLVLVQQALEKGFEVIAFIRRPESITQKHPKFKIIVGNLNEGAKLKEAIAGADACISTLGGSSLTKRSIAITSGIQDIIQIAEEAGVKRFIYLSSWGAGESKKYMNIVARKLIADFFLRVPLADHNENEQNISKSKLDWTILRPGSLTDGEITDHLHFSDENIKLKGNPSISRKSLASFIIKQIEDTSYINKAVWIHQ
jgi:putative NADH-flavin reductase